MTPRDVTAICWVASQFAFLQLIDYREGHDKLISIEFC